MEQNESIGRWIWSIHRHVNIYLDAEFKKYGIGSGQVIFLRALQSEDGISQEKLTAMFRVNKATTARAVDKLVKEGYATRKKDSADKRAYKIYLTEKGRRFEPELKKIFRQLTATLSLGFTEDEKESVLLLLKQMFQNILSVTGKNGALADE